MERLSSFLRTILRVPQLFKTSLSLHGTRELRKAVAHVGWRVILFFFSDRKQVLSSTREALSLALQLSLLLFSSLFLSLLLSASAPLPLPRRTALEPSAERAPSLSPSSALFPLWASSGASYTRASTDPTVSMP